MALVQIFNIIMTEMSNKRYNLEKELSDFLATVEEGDILRFERGLYKHYAIYWGHARVDGVYQPAVVDIDGERTTYQVAVASLLKVAGTSLVSIDNFLDKEHRPLAMEEIRRRVTAVIQRRQNWPDYNLVTNNCEHFVTWARNGCKVSQQIDGGISLILGPKW
jgi:hypothetical protein